MRKTRDLTLNPKTPDTVLRALRERVAQAARAGFSAGETLAEGWPKMRDALALTGIEAMPIDAENGLARMASDAARAGDQAAADRFLAMRAETRDPTNFDPLSI